MLSAGAGVRPSRVVCRLLVEHAMRTMDQDNGPLLRAIRQRLER